MNYSAYRLENVMLLVLAGLLVLFIGLPVATAVRGALDQASASLSSALNPLPARR